jgi:chemotaxis protein CheD
MRPPACAPLDILEIFLQPGEFYFGDEKTRIRTLLGSCVAIVLWHPKRRIGGMCHFMLPHRPREGGGGPLDGRYAGDAMQMFMRELRRTGTSPHEYHAKLIGGGRMFERAQPAGHFMDVCERNMHAARELIIRHRFRLHGHDMGGHGHRNVIFDLWNGDVWLRRVPLLRLHTAGKAKAGSHGDR